MNKIRLKILKYRWKLIKLARIFGVDLKISLNIPSAFITGSVGKTTTCRMLAAILAKKGVIVGLSTTQGLYIGKETIRVGDSANCQFASRLLVDRRIQTAVFELARGGLLQQGIVFNGCSVAAVLNVYDNHLGERDVYTREDMAAVKKVVAGSAENLVALNADDPLCLAMRDQVMAPDMCLVSMHSDNPVINEHMDVGGEAVFLDNTTDPAIKLYKGEKLIGAIPATEIPASYNGSYRPALFNAMFAVALAYGMGVEFNVIRHALNDFRSDEENNPGRMNLYEHLPFRVLVTWADGEQALKELAYFVKSMNLSNNKYLMFCTVGNPPDQYIKDMGRSVAGHFTHYICSDFVDLRGRPNCEAAELLSDGLIENGVSRENISVASSHQSALEIALNMPSADDFLVICTYAFDAAREALLMRRNSTEVVSSIRGNDINSSKKITN